MNTAPGTDIEKQDFLYSMARLCLRKLNVDFTDQFLKQAIIQAYQSTLEIQYADAEDENKISVADRDDPSNLAIVLLDALKKYHIKNEVSDVSVSAKNSITLAILSKKKDEQNYRQLLKVMDAGSDQDQYSLENNTVENYVILKKSRFTGEPGYILNRNSERIRKTSVVILTVLLLATLGLAVYNGIENYKLILWMPLLVIVFAGCIVCYHLFKLEKSNVYASKLLKKICTSDKNDLNCKQVISSAASKLFGVISLTDIGSIYFGSILSFALAGLLTNNYENHLNLLFWSAVLPVPFTFFSVYYQLRVIKKICVLCMITQTLLLVQFLYFIFILPGINIRAIGPEDFIQFALSASIVSLLYFLFTENQGINRRMNALSAENLKFKNTAALFKDTMAGQGKFIDERFPSTLVLGNPSAKVKLNAILSLSCAPCAAKLKDLLKLGDWFENGICINILLKADMYSTSILKNLLAHTQEGNTEQAAGMLTRWYDFFLSAKEKGVKDLSDIAAAWERKYPSNGWTENVEALYALHEQCYKTHPVPFTPLIEYNDQLLAGPYHDIELLSNRIEQNLE